MDETRDYAHRIVENALRHELLPNTYLCSVCGHTPAGAVAVTAGDTTLAELQERHRLYVAVTETARLWLDSVTRRLKGDPRI